jgi:hypothetical protein
LVTPTTWPHIGHGILPGGEGILPIALPLPGQTFIANSKDMKTLDSGTILVRRFRDAPQTSFTLCMAFSATIPLLDAQQSRKIFPSRPLYAAHNRFAALESRVEPGLCCDSLLKQLRKS